MPATQRNDRMSCTGDGQCLYFVSGIRYAASNDQGAEQAMTDTAEHHRRIELERADAMRSVIERAVKRIEGHTVKGESYRKALKLAVRLVRESLIVE